MTQKVTQTQSAIFVVEEEAATLDCVYEAGSYGYYLKIRHHIEKWIASFSIKISKNTTSSGVEVKSRVWLHNAFDIDSFYV